MLHEEPEWTVVAARPLTQGYGHVMLTPGHALGQWICIRRGSGHVLWDHDVDRPNAVRGISGGVVIASEYRPVGLMGGGGFHCYALELETGKLLWTTHPSGDMGRGSPDHYWYPDR